MENVEEQNVNLQLNIIQILKSINQIQHINI